MAHSLLYFGPTRISWIIRILSLICPSLCSNCGSIDRFIEETILPMEWSCATSFSEAKNSHDHPASIGNTWFFPALWCNYRCFRRCYRCGTISANASSLIFQQKDVPQDAGCFSLWSRDVRHHRISQKVASLFVGETFLRLYWSEESSRVGLSNNPNPFTVKMAHKTPWVWLWDIVDPGTHKRSCWRPVQAPWAWV